MAAYSVGYMRRVGGGDVDYPHPLRPWLIYDILSNTKTYTT